MNGLARGIDVTKDRSSQALLEITYAHAGVHRDIIINASHVQAAADGELLFFIKTSDDPHKQMHLEYLVTAGGDCEVRFYRAPTIDAEGTEVPTRRLMDGSTKTTGAKIFVGGSVVDSAYGTLLKSQYNGGGGQGSGVRGGSSVHADAEWVPQLDENYCIRLTRTGSQKVGVEFEWYEVPEIKL